MTFSICRSGHPDIRGLTAETLSAEWVRVKGELKPGEVGQVFHGSVCLERYVAELPEWRIEAFGGAAPSWHVYQGSRGWGPVVRAATAKEALLKYLGVGRELLRRAGRW